MKTTKFIRVYMGVSTVAFSVWLLIVGVKLITLAGHFVARVVTTVLHSIPVLG